MNRNREETFHPRAKYGTREFMQQIGRKGGYTTSCRYFGKHCDKVEGSSQKRSSNRKSGSRGSNRDTFYEPLGTRSFREYQRGEYQPLQSNKRVGAQRYSGCRSKSSNFNDF